jgi:hypothetical protein
MISNFDKERLSNLFGDVVVLEVCEKRGRYDDPQLNSSCAPSRFTMESALYEKQQHEIQTTVIHLRLLQVRALDTFVPVPVWIF